MQSIHFIDKDPDTYEALLYQQKRSIELMDPGAICDVVDKFEQLIKSDNAPVYE